MSLHHTTTANFQNQLFTTASDTATRKLASFADKYSGRALFATRFSPEDQVVAHLIFRNKLPFRVFTFSGTDQHNILVRSVDFFKNSIEVSSQQARLAAAEFAVRHPEIARGYEQSPATAPLGQILQDHHLLVSSRRKDQVPVNSNYTSLEWDEANQRAIFYPLLDWTEKQVQAYLAHCQIPQISETPPLVQETFPSAFSVWVNKLPLILAKRRDAASKKQDLVNDIFTAPRPKQALFSLSE